MLLIFLQQLLYHPITQIGIIILVKMDDRFVRLNNITELFLNRDKKVSQVFCVAKEHHQRDVPRSNLLQKRKKAVIFKDVIKKFSFSLRGDSTKLDHRRRVLVIEEVVIQPNNKPFNDFAGNKLFDAVVNSVL